MKFIAYQKKKNWTYNGAECFSKLRLPANKFGQAIVDYVLSMSFSSKLFLWDIMSTLYKELFTINECTKVKIRKLQ